MFNKTSFYVFLLLLGISLIAISLFLRGEEVKGVSGVLIGIGAGLFGISLLNLYMKRYQQAHPEIKKQNEIEFNDERNEIIRYKAKAKSGDIIQWLVMGLAYVMILFDYPLWLIAITVGIFLLYNLIMIYFVGKYQKEM